MGFFISWIRGLAEKFDKIVVLCLNDGNYSLPANVKVYGLGKNHGAGKLKQFFTFYLLLFTLRHNYDAVFVHMNPIWVVLGGPFWRLAGKKVFFWYTSGGVTTKLRLAEKFSNIILTASKESFRLLSKKVIVTGHGIDTELFKPNLTRLNLETPSLRFNLGILSVGRIAPVKNYETLIDAAKILKDRGPIRSSLAEVPTGLAKSNLASETSNGMDFSVTIVGEAPLEGDRNYEVGIRNKIKNLGLEDKFNFTGKVNHNDLPGYYQSHDIFIHLSKTGSLDKTILEAMACGMKVLSSNDASRSFLSQEFIFNDSNSSELAQKIITLVNTHSDEKLREYVIQNHNLGRLINKISSIIQS